MKGLRVLEHVIRTQTAASRPGFDVDGVLQGVVEAALALTVAEAAAVVLRGRGRIASAGEPARGDSSLAVPLPPTAPTQGMLVVYVREERRFTADDRRVLDLLARLIGTTLTRAALDEASRPRALRH
jgi:GAF domain-containing protein